VGAAVAGAVDAGLEAAAEGVDGGVAALPVCASAVNVKLATIARGILRNLLFIGLIELLGT
jgi:hypothetical protein